MRGHLEGEEMKTFLVFAAAVLIASGCAGSRTLSGAKPNDARLVCLNEHPSDIRVGVAGMEYGIPAHDTVSAPAHCGTEYRVRRRMFLNGTSWDDYYSFFIPEGAAEKIIIFGGVQTGVIVNRSGHQINVASPAGTFTGWVKSGGAGGPLQSPPGLQIFVVKFDDGKIYEGRFSPNDVRGDSFFNGEWTDWVIYIDPSVHTRARLPK